MRFDFRGNDCHAARIFEETGSDIRDLLFENGRLRERIARLEEDRQSADDGPRPSASLHSDLAALLSRMAEAEAASEKARARMEWLELQAESHRKRREELERRVVSLEKEKQQQFQSYLELEQQNTNLANLYVASHRLHSTLDRGEVLAGIQEIIINLIGSEELAVFELRTGERAPRLAASFGLEFRSFGEFPAEAQEAIEQSLRNSEICIGQDDGAGFRPTVCIPLLVDGRVIGVIAVFRFLQQKLGIENVDRDLFDLLSTNAATALYVSSLDERGPEEVS